MTIINIDWRASYKLDCVFNCHFIGAKIWKFHMCTDLQITFVVYIYTSLYTTIVIAFNSIMWIVSSFLTAGWQTISRWILTRTRPVSRSVDIVDLRYPSNYSLGICKPSNWFRTLLCLSVSAVVTGNVHPICSSTCRLRKESSSHTYRTGQIFNRFNKFNQILFKVCI